MPAVPWLVDGPRSMKVFVTAPDAASSTVPAAVVRLDNALTGFASPPAAWFGLLERLGNWWFLVCAVIATAAFVPVLEGFGSGLAIGVITGLILGAASRALLEKLAKSLARRKAGKTAAATVEELEPVVRVASGGLDWADAVVAAEPGALHEVHLLMWRITDLTGPDGRQAADELYKRWKRIDPKAAAEIEAEDAAELALLKESERQERP